MVVSGAVVVYKCVIISEYQVTKNEIKVSSNTGDRFGTS